MKVRTYIAFTVAIIILIMTACSKPQDVISEQIENHLNNAENYISAAEYDKAYEEYGKALKISKKGNGEQSSKTAEIYLRHGEYAPTVEESMRDIEKAEAIYKSLDDEKGLAKSYYTYGVVYEQVHDDENAVDAFEKVLDICNESEADLDNIKVDTYIQLSMFKESLEEKLQYYEKAEKLFNSLNKEEREKRAILLYSNFGNTYVNFEKWNLAAEKYEAAIQYWENGKADMYDLEVARCFCFCGGCYAIAGDYEKAISYLNQSLELLKGQKDAETEDYVNVYRYLSVIYTTDKMQNYERALEYALNACKLYTQQKELSNKQLDDLKLLKEDLKKVYYKSSSEASLDFETWYQEHIDN